MAVALLCASARAVAAQEIATPATSEPATERRPALQIAISATAGAPLSFGSSSATLQRPDGSRLPLFSTESREGADRGLDVAVAMRVMPRLAVEVAGGWSRSAFETRISDDLEGASPATVTASVARFTAGAGASWTLHAGRQLDWFVRGRVSWMRELVASSRPFDDAAIAHAGLGVKYWWVRGGRPGLQYGLQAEGRLAVRRAGPGPGARDVHLAPGVAVGLIIGS